MKQFLEVGYSMFTTFLTILIVGVVSGFIAGVTLAVTWWVL